MNITINGCENEMKQTECCSNSGYAENESRVCDNGGASSFCNGEQFERSTDHRVNETSPQTQEKSRHYRQATVPTRRSLSLTKDSSLDINITPTFSLNPKISTSPFPCVANKGDFQPLKNIFYTGPANRCYIFNDTGGPSSLPQQDRIRKMPELLLTPREVKFATKSNRLDGLSLHSSEELGNGFCKTDDLETQYSQTRSVDKKTPVSPGEYQQKVDGLKSLYFKTIRTKRVEYFDETIASNMIRQGMPSLISTACSRHHLPMVVNSGTNDDTIKKFKSSARSQLVSYASKIPLPCRFQKLSLNSCKLKVKKEAQMQQTTVHFSRSLRDKHPDDASTPGAAALPLVDRVEKKKPINFKSVYSKRKFPSVQLLITPAPEKFKNLEMRLGLENDEEPVVKVPNYFLDFIPEYRRNESSVPKLEDISQATSGENGQAKTQLRFLCHKSNGETVDKVIKEDAYAKNTNLEITPTRKGSIKETNVSGAFQSSKESAVSFLEEPKSNPTSQILADVVRPTIYEIPLPDNSLLAWQDEYQEEFPPVAVPLKMNGDTKSSNQARISFESISEFGSLFPEPKEANCKPTKSQAVVSNGNTETFRFFSKGSNREDTQEQINCSALHKHRIAPMEDGNFLGILPKYRILNERETNKPKYIKPPELVSVSYNQPTDTVTAEEFFFHSSGHPLSSVTPDYKMISSCTPTSAVVQDSTTAASPDKRKHQCEVCGRAFSRSNTLITHNRIHTGDRPFPCDVCGRAFRQLGNLTRHKLTHTVVKPHACPICKKYFSRTSNLNTHMRTHTNYKPFLCDFCGKGFHQKVDMKIHRYTHTGEKPHKCTKCGRGFKQLTHLKYHMRTHSAVRLYECEHCGKSFNQKGNLKAHIYGHTGNRPYRCEICGKGFTLTSTLNTHKRTHAPLKPFKCNFCEKAFYQKNALKTHYISSHPYTDGVCLL